MLQIRDVMTRHVFTMTPETTLREAADLFSRHHISGAPVLAGHSVVGVISASDLLEFVATNDDRRSESNEGSGDEGDERARGDLGDEASGLYFNDCPPETEDDADEPFEMDAAPRADFLHGHTVEELMTRTICSLPPEAAIGDAAQYMWQAGIHRLLVMEDGQLRGIVSMSDVARLLATTS